MKKTLLFSFIFMLAFSCSLDNDNELNAYSEFVPIQSASFPDYFEFGQIYQITYNYLRPSTCYSFRDLYYLKEDNTRTIAVIAHVLISDNCEPLVDENIERSFDFKVNEQTGSTYFFKFWQGEDEDGEDIFVTYEIRVQ